jgi:hypothetical protein
VTDTGTVAAIRGETGPIESNDLYRHFYRNTSMIKLPLDPNLSASLVDQIVAGL